MTESQGRLTWPTAQKAYSILVEHCGAPEAQRMAFVQYHTMVLPEHVREKETTWRLLTEVFVTSPQGKMWLECIGSWHNVDRANALLGELRALAHEAEA